MKWTSATRPVSLLCAHVYDSFRNKKEKERKGKRKDNKGGEKGSKLDFGLACVYMCIMVPGLFLLSLPHHPHTFSIIHTISLYVKWIHISFMSKSLFLLTLCDVCTCMHLSSGTYRQCMSPFCFPAQACPIPLFARQNFANDIQTTTGLYSIQLKARMKGDETTYR